MRPDTHRSVDLDVLTGTPIEAMAESRVRFPGAMTGFGNVVWLDYGRVTITVYAHLSAIYVREGDHLAASQILGLSETSGNVTALHLHF